MHPNHDPIGESISRVEGKDKVTGKAKYSSADHTFPRLVYAVLVQSEVPHGTVTSRSLERMAVEVAKANGILHVDAPRLKPD